MCLLEIIYLYKMYNNAGFCISSNVKDFKIPDIIQNILSNFSINKMSVFYLYLNRVAFRKVCEESCAYKFF